MVPQNDTAGSGFAEACEQPVYRKAGKKEGSLEEWHDMKKLKMPIDL